jgi:octopine/nopaline transport system substrate-binding protein
MKPLVSTMALIVGPNVIAAATNQSLKSLKSIVLGASLAASLAPPAFAKEWKTVAIAVDGAYAPWNFTDSSGQIVGFEPDLAMDLCKRAGFECKIISQDWDGMIPGLKAGKFDAIIDGMSITEERKKEIDFSKPYAAPPVAFMAAKDGPVAKALGPAKVVDATRDPAAGEVAIKAVQVAIKGMTIGVQSSTIHAKFANKYLKDMATVKEYKSSDDRDLDLKAGRIDVALDSSPAMAALLEKPDSKGLEIIGPEFKGNVGGVFGGVGTGIGLRKSDADLTAAFNNALDAAFADGSVQKYSIKWFKVDTTPSDR